MAKVRGFLKLQGSMGDTTFMKQKNGNNWRAQDKLVISPDRFKSDPKFARVRENATEFTRAASGGKLIREAISSLLSKAKDKNLSTRLFSKLMTVIKTDVTSPRGGGNLVDGDINLIKGFSFSAGGSLAKVLDEQVITNIDRVTGHMTINIPVFVPTLDLSAPPGTTHFQFVSAGSELDFESESFKTDIQKGAATVYDTNATTAVTLTHSVTANSTKPLFLVIGIKFYESSGGIMSPLMTARTNVLEVIAVSKP